MMDLSVYHESASYWDVGEQIEGPPAYVAGEIQPGELVFMPVCRVRKHAQGKANLQAILAIPAMYAALQQTLAWFTNGNACEPGEVASSVIHALREAGVPTADLNAAAISMLKGAAHL